MKDIILTTVACLSFLVSGLLVYWRENKKLFQEKIFEQKLGAYKEVLEELGMYYEDVFSFLNFFQYYDKSEEQWLIDSKPYFDEYFPKAFALKRLYYKNLILLPEPQLTHLNETLGRCIRHITVHHHIHTTIPFDSHDELYDLIATFAEKAREDLSISVLNAALNKRLAQEFYPISLPKKAVYERGM
ncbi:hypothetical protein [Fibrivirga algicola]|uniref:Uncharacterized protein n=1 Tax=Fibrivirga algicola TaxID=2950420 RepID=A0ABX0QMQ0_9BACT|nr:hypothetical protein [Fibrivirga algicola]NID13749.1 hypothetical protein [Fibrivirga algicola]